MTVKSHSEFIAFILGATEFERGWGQRPDGVLAFRNEAGADVFLKQVAEERQNNTTVPDDYTNFDKRGYQEVSERVFTDLMNYADDGYVWYPHGVSIKKE